MTLDRHIRTVEDVLRLLDDMFIAEADRWTTRGGSTWWDTFYANRDRPVPFFAAKPDENLASYLARGLLAPAGPGVVTPTGGAVTARGAITAGRALDLGCGPGRNAIHLAAAGYPVDAVDLSPAAIAWARDRATEAGVDVRFHQGDIFALTESELTGPYDLIYDSGCFHHLPPHRRISYLALLDRALAPGGHFALTCFAVGTENSGSERPDADFYRNPTLDGGLAYAPDSLRTIFANLTELELRPMRDEPPQSPYFGEPFLLTALFRKAA